MSRKSEMQLKDLPDNGHFVFIDYKRDPDLNGRVWQKVDDYNSRTTRIFITKAMINVMSDALVRPVFEDCWVGMPESALVS
ncbi:hypothetical protein KKC88_03745 [Patescibacteria group bacterium]|nr:hypothetical protein [Patescibacteria group bacterium]MBU1673376.1 hypothetical protein [Patescibacteria group bacterium]